MSRSLCPASLALALLGVAGVFVAVHTTSRLVCRSSGGAEYTTEDLLLPDAFDGTAEVPWLGSGAANGKGAPRDWTHKIFKARLRLAGDAPPERARSMPGEPLLALKARVLLARDGGHLRFRLSGIAYDLGFRIAGKDIVLSPQLTDALLSADLPPQFGGPLARAREVARSETIVVLDVPAAIPGEDRLRPVVERFAVLVDADNGRVETACWPLELNRPVDWLPPRANQQRELFWDGEAFRPGLPAVQRPLQLLAEVRQLGSRPQLSKEEAMELERGLREAMRAGNQAATPDGEEGAADGTSVE